MRTLGTIIEEARDGNPITAEESLMAMLALAHLSDLVRNDMKLQQTDAPLCAMIEYARLTDPLEYLGDNRPGFADYDSRRERANRIMARLDPALHSPEILDTLRQIGDTMPPADAPPSWWPQDKKGL